MVGETVNANQQEGGKRVTKVQGLAGVQKKITILAKQHLKILLNAIGNL